MMTRVLALFGLLFLTACTDATQDLSAPPEPLGDFQLGFVGVAANGARGLLATETISEETWVAEVEAAVEARFNRFEGARYYNLGIKVAEYSVPPPIIPGKSALALLVTVWDDSAGTKLNEEVEPIAVIRVFESRLAATTEERVTALAEIAAKQIEDWLREQMVEQGWFMTPAEETPVPTDG